MPRSTIKSETPNEGHEDISAWLSEVRAAEDSPNRDRFIKRAEAAYRSYAAGGTIVESSKSESIERSYATFWNSVQTLKPYLFFNLPEPRAERINAADNAPIDKEAAEALERNLTVQQEIQPLKDVIELATEQYLIASFGQVWVRYEYEESTDPTGQTAVSHEVAAVDHVHFKDWIMPDYRTWLEVMNAWSGRKLYLTRDEVRLRFGISGDNPDGLTEEEIAHLTYSHKPENSDKPRGEGAKAGLESLERTCVYEICDLRDDRRLFVSHDLTHRFLKIAENVVVKFRDGCPFPKPLMGTQGEDTVWPVVDYVYLRDAEKTIKEAADTKRELAKKCKPKAAVNGEFGKELKDLFESNASKGLAVKNWASFAQQGGISGAMEFLPVEEYARCLEILSGVLDMEVRAFEQLSGITDLMKGIADPRNSEGTNAQIGVYGDKRTSGKQSELARFVRDVIRLQTDVICDAFDPQTIARNARIQQNPEAPQIIQLIKNEQERLFAIDIETDDTIETDERAYRQELNEFMNALMQVMQVAFQIMQLNPAYSGVVNEILLMTVRAFFSGRKVEETLEEAFKKADMMQQQQAQQQQQMQEQQNAQMQQMQQFQMQIQQLQANLAQRETAVNELEAQIKQFAAQSKASLDAQKLQADTGKAAQELEFKEQKQDQDSAIKVAEMNSKEAIESQKIQDQRVQHVTGLVNGSGQRSDNPQAPK